MVWIISSWKPFPRICILVSLHYFPLRQTDHWRLSGSGMRPLPLSHARDTRGIIWKGKEGVKDMEGKPNIAFGSKGENVAPHHQHCHPPVTWCYGERGEMQGSCLGSPTGYRTQCRPGWWWQADSDQWWAASPGRRHSVLEQKRGNPRPGCL